MIMTAKEAMQALLVGETLERDDPWCLIKLDDKGNLVKCDTKYPLKKNEFKDFCTLIGTMNGIYEEYPLNFEQALREMLDGKVVETRVSHTDIRIPHRFNREHSCFEYYSTCDGEWWETQISEPEQKSKWKVVK